jgi:site-specific DNA-methyltransferase (adenine-specific)
MRAIGFGDSGSAARFFYTAKADANDRIGSQHPTIKPLDLMRWLCRLVTPPGGLVLDPFAGTGTTGEAAWREGLRAVLIEADRQSQADIRRRLALVHAGPVERNTESAKARDRQLDPLPLFNDRNAKPAELPGGGMPFGGQSV